MTRLEKRYKSLLAVLLLLVVVVELILTRAWLLDQRGIQGALWHFFQQLRIEPLYQITMVDFTAVALLVFCWMAWDSKRRGHWARAWLWLPLFILYPSMGLLCYLLTRRGWEFPFPQDEA